MKKTQKKNKIFAILGIIVFIVAVLQIIMLVILFKDKSPNHIIYNGEVVTTEVCENWFNLTEKERDSLDYFFYKKNMIPLNVVNPVCDRWLKVKIEVDKNEI